MKFHHFVLLTLCTVLAVASLAFSTAANFNLR